MRPKKHLEYYSRVYTDAWKQTDSMRSERGKALPWWPEWCFMPLSGAYAIVSAEAESQGLAPGMVLTPGPLVNDVGVVGALAAWRVTQGVYRFDPDIYKAVIDTEITGDLPHEIFFNLPEWCVYIETPDLTYMGVRLFGFFAHLEYDTGTNRKELRLVLDLPGNDKTPYLLPMPIHLGTWSLIESIERVIQESNRQFGTPDSPIDPNLTKVMKQELEALVSLLLYLCSANGEIGRDGKRPVKPKSTKTKKGLRLFPPNVPKAWDVGVRMGAAIRQGREVRTQSERAEGSMRASPRTHVRHVHWQGYWTGPRDAEERQYILKWIAPIIVNPGDELPVTIRPVE